jgi:hypothetical protein
MHINVVVTIGQDDSFAYTPDAAATQVLAALGGNPTKDYCACTVQMPASTGNAGTPDLSNVSPPPTPGPPPGEVTNE